MKKAFLLASILFISVISTACINNFAIQELNAKAQEYMEKGDYAAAIERLKSSIDLDGSIFETQYNLAVAYTKAEDYENAIKTYNDAIKLNPDFADSYYSLAVCEENLAKDIISKDVTVMDDGTYKKADENSDDAELSDKAKSVLTSLLNSAISDYQIYLDKTEENSEDVENSIEGLQELIKKYGNVSIAE